MKFMAFALALSVVAVSTSGCVATEPPMAPRGTVVSGPPPPPVAESRPAQPSPQAVWLDGYWHWSGMQYTWIPGRWEVPPAGARWSAPQYTVHGGTHTYENGRWSKPQTVHGIR